MSVAKKNTQQTIQQVLSRRKTPMTINQLCERLSNINPSTVKRTVHYMVADNLLSKTELKKVTMTHSRGRPVMYGFTLAA